MECPIPVRLGASLLFLLALGACQREAAAPEATPVAPAPAPVAAPEPESPDQAELKDVIETTPQYIVGISYPATAREHPGLAAELKQYAEAARAELEQALPQRKSSPGAPLYDLTLSFTELHSGPDLIAIAADGSRFTGGAHGEPLIARWVWLPRENRRLTAAELVPSPRSWETIARNVREQLYTALSQRLDADGLAPEERANMLRTAGKMIDEGTRPDPRHFSTFEPVMTPAGKIAALRFVFPPYQVGPYSDGTQTVDVPAAVLLPHVAPKYRALFDASAS